MSIKQLVRNALFLFAATLLALAIFYLLSNVRNEPRSQIALLLDAAGKKAIAAVRDPEERQRLAVLYRDFVERVKRGQIGRSWVERVAAHALNLGYRGTPANDEEVTKLKETLILARNVPPNKANLSRDEWQKLGRRIQAADHVLAYWKARRTDVGDSAAALPARLRENLEPEIDSSLVRQLRALEERQRQLEAFRREQMQQLEARRRMLDSLRRTLESQTMPSQPPDSAGSHRAGSPP